MDPGPEHLLIVGDAASLPAVNSLLDAFPETPATIWFETANDDELPHPTADRHDLKLIPRADDGDALVSRVRKDLPELAEDPAATYFWIACEAKCTRALTTFARKEIGITKDRMHSMAYWRG